MSIITACHKAIHDENIISLYKAANIDVSHLLLDIDPALLSTLRMDKNGERLPVNKKHQLILMCESELLLMWNAIESEEAQKGSVAALNVWNKHLDTAYREYLTKAIRIIKEHPNGNLMVICKDALHDLNVVSLYKAANFDIMSLEADLADVEGVRIGHLEKTLNKKEMLISMCHTEMTLMKAMAAERVRENSKASDAEKGEPQNLKDRIKQNEGNQKEEWTKAPTP